MGELSILICFHFSSIQSEKSVGVFEETKSILKFFWLDKVTRDGICFGVWSPEFLRLTKTVIQRFFQVSILMSLGATTNFRGQYFCCSDNTQIAFNLAMRCDAFLSWRGQDQLGEAQPHLSVLLR